MVPDRPAGSYRQPRVGLRCERVTCIHCGLIRALAPEHGQDVELWYRASVRGQPIDAGRERRVPRHGLANSSGCARM